MKFFPKLLFLFILSSCNTLYKPTGINVPLHDQAGDFLVSGNYGSAGAEIQLSAAFSDHFYISTNASYLRTKTKEDSIIRYRSMEYAIGYYKLLENTDDLKFDFAAGYGFGDFNYHYLFETIPIQMRYHVSSNYHKWFIQPSIGRSENDIEMALSLKMSFMHHYNFTDYYSRRNIDISSMNPVGYIEPCYTIRIGLKKISLFGQFGIVSPLTPKHPLSKAAFFGYGAAGLSIKLNLKPEQDRKAFY